MSLPTDRQYTASHEWVKAEGDLLLVGITDIAQEQLGDIVFVGEVKIGTTVQAGALAGVVESVKAASDIYAPVAGKIVAFNDALAQNPHLINEAAFDTWIFKLKADPAHAGAPLLDAAGYKASLSAPGS
jgi:glycine cleavage system H protein